MKRRAFLKNTGVAFAGMGIPTALLPLPIMPANNKLIQVASSSSNFEREKLVRPFGFKGGYLTELWQTVIKLSAESGESGIGLATQSVLYGDPQLFATHSEAAGNALMYALADAIAQEQKQVPFADPVDLFDKTIAHAQSAAVRITGKADVNRNFVYNAMVGPDNAAWVLYARVNGFQQFDQMIPPGFREALAHRNRKIAVMFQVPYGMPVSEIQQAVQDGYFVIKIKAGAPGDQEQMLAADMQRLTQIHQAIGHLTTHQTADGKLIYTVDANGRYEKKSSLQKYLAHADKIGALQHIQLYEEPFVETNQESVDDLGIRVGADESVHTEADALRRLDQGYSVLVLKGIAKTLSLSLKIARLTAQKNKTCICADLTVNPILVDWHKNLAARLAPFPGLGMGMMETNGAMNYVRWKEMQQYHPMAGAPFTAVKQGCFELDDDFYTSSAGILMPAAHYENMFTKKS